ncbi:hypothetical protein BCR32DRAFT_271779 [Anaeromyces robustus]|uniref:Uncharacterized protein n=1 Tax=Anaeromyces robustus TaxID=1754192 RepID=A0A1Y1WQS0_9FUNG|nr:hypothetical protein BCR32DRAFT_271779 [Anaeromyces robustus]|eukprot:ORX75638.1 hypothetical protein BCR32DRAFT_271779 [Anaeromyces robustus]
MENIINNSMNYILENENDDINKIKYKNFFKDTENNDDLLVPETEQETEQQTEQETETDIYENKQDKNYNNFNSFTENSTTTSITSTEYPGKKIMEMETETETKTETETEIYENKNNYFNNFNTTTETTKIVNTEMETEVENETDNYNNSITTTPLETITENVNTEMETEVENETDNYNNSITTTPPETITENVNTYILENPCINLETENKKETEENKTEMNTEMETEIETETTHLNYIPQYQVFEEIYDTNDINNNINTNINNNIKNNNEINKKESNYPIENSEKTKFKMDVMFKKIIDENYLFKTFNDSVVIDVYEEFYHKNGNLYFSDLNTNTNSTKIKNISNNNTTEIPLSTLNTTINDIENKNATTSTNIDTEMVEHRKKRSLTRENAFYYETPEEKNLIIKKLINNNDDDNIDNIKKPYSIFYSAKKRLNFNLRYNNEIFRNYILRKIHLQKQKQTSIAMATLRRNHNNNIFRNSMRAASSTHSSTYTMMNEKKHFNIKHIKNIKILNNILNKYDISNFIARQRYKVHMKIDYYKSINRHRQHIHKPQKDFKDYMKEYEEEKYETNPYLQEYYDEDESEEEEDENENEMKVEDIKEEKGMSKDDDDDNYKNKLSLTLNKLKEQKEKLLNNLFNGKKHDEPLSHHHYHKRKNSKDNKENFTYYRQSYDDERNSRNIYLNDDYNEESYKRQPRLNKRELNKIILREMQKRHFENSSYNRTNFRDQLRKKGNKNEFHHFSSEEYQLEDVDKENYYLCDSNILEKMKMNNRDEKEEIEEIEENEKEKEMLLNKIENNKNDGNEIKIEIEDKSNIKKIKKSVSFNLKTEEDDEDEPPCHEPNNNINPLTLKSCLSKQYVNYDKKLLFMTYGNKKSEEGKKSPEKGSEIIASSIITEFTPELKDYIGDNFGNYFTGYTYNNFYYFNGKQYTLLSMFNPKLFYREYFNNDNTIGNDQSNKEWMKFFRMINLYRSIITTIYGVYELYQNLIDENIKKFGATTFVIIGFVFVLVDLLIAFIKTYPNKIWFFWNVKNWVNIKEK